MALALSFISFVVSTIITISQQKSANKRYNEQKEINEVRLKEEREMRLKDKLEADERIRIGERPYLICKEAKIIQYDKENSRIIFSMSFLNKGRGPSFETYPDTQCTASLEGKFFTIHRYENVEDHVVQVNELLETKWFYEGTKQLHNYRMNFSIKYSDASDRKYEQFFVIDIIDHKTFNTVKNETPKLL